MFKRTMVAMMLGVLYAVAATGADDSTGTWKKITVPAARDVVLEGPVGNMLQRGLNRLTIPPFTASYIRSDVSYENIHCFYDYSGSNVGEALEVWSQNSPTDRLQPKAFAELLATIEPLQKPDGHFGADIDVAKPISHANIATPVLWGNTRMLAGLVTCWRCQRDEQMLRMAKKLGDFYVGTGDVFCSPQRIEEYKSFVNGNEGIETCYFPAIEGLATLYAETEDARYLKQARRMADLFLEHFTENRNGHWSGHLMDWRGVLFLYDVTGERYYLNACQIRWDDLLQNKISLGGGIIANGIDTCFFEDWLRLSLELWRLTGNVRCLDAVERLVHNVYGEQQTPNGGFGYRCWEGAIGAASNGITRTSVPNSPWCCDYMGPGGLLYYKSYQAAGSDDAVYVNFFDSFTSQVKAAGVNWQITARNTQDVPGGLWTSEISLFPSGNDAAKPVVLRVRVPVWASGVKSVGIHGQDVASKVADGYLNIEHAFHKDDVVRIVFDAGLRVEGPGIFQTVHLEPEKAAVVPSVAVVSGPNLLYAIPVSGAGRPALLATVSGTGELGLLTASDGGFATVIVPKADANATFAAPNLDTATIAQLEPWSQITTRQRSIFSYDLAVATAGSISAAARERFAKRAQTAKAEISGPFFGEDLQNRTELWPGKAALVSPYDILVFDENGMTVQGNGVSLMDGHGYTDYRFSFDMTLPKDSQGVGSWIVRAQDVNNCLMFRLWCQTSPVDYPEAKETPSPERAYMVPILYRNGEPTNLTPVPAPKTIVHGQTVRITVECRGVQVDVSVDGVKFHTMQTPEWRTGNVGFFASWPWNKGVYDHISLQRLP